MPAPLVGKPLHPVCSVFDGWWSWGHTLQELGTAQKRSIYEFPGNACWTHPGAWLESLSPALACLLLPSYWALVSSSRAGERIFYRAPLTFLACCPQPSTKGLLHPLAPPLQFSSSITGITGISVRITDSIYPLWGLNYSTLVNLLRVLHGLPTVENYTREQLGCAEIHTLIFHCFLSTVSKYYFIWTSHFSLVLANICCAVNFFLALWMAVWQVRLPAFPQGP